MIFVTGGTGLLGTHVLLELLSRGEKIRALKRSTSDLNMVKSVFDYYLKGKSEEEFNKIEWVEGDILDITSLEEGIMGCSIVYHCAALVSFKRRDFKNLIKLNKYGTANVVNVCLGQNIDHLVYVSSTAALGRTEDKEVYDEENKWVKSGSNTGYSISKYSAENEVWRGVEEGLDAVIVNPSVILGIGDWNESSLSIFKVVKNGLKFYTSGANAFVDARDVAFIMAELSKRRIVNDRFLCISENLYFKELFDKIAKGFNVKAPSIKVKKWMANLAWKIEGILGFFGRKQNITRETARSSMSVTKYSNTKIRKLLNFEFITIDQSVENAVGFFNNKK